MLYKETKKFINSDAFVVNKCHIKKKKKLLNWKVYLCYDHINTDRFVCKQKCHTMGKCCHIFFVHCDTFFSSLL